MGRIPRRAPRRRSWSGFDGAEGGRDALELGRVLSSIRGARCTVAVPEAENLAEEAREGLEDPRAEINVIGILSPAMMLTQCASPPPPPPSPPCDANYKGACLDPNASDYDCAGGEGDGPRYVEGPIEVVGEDRFDLDRNGDGIACEP